MCDFLYAYIILCYVILYYNIMETPSYVRSVFDRNVVICRMTVVLPLCYLAGIRIHRTACYQPCIWYTTLVSLMQNEVWNRMFIMISLVFALSRSYAILGNLRDIATGGGDKIWRHYFIWQLSLLWRMSASRTKRKKKHTSRRRHKQLRLVVYLWLVWRHCRIE